MLGGAALRVPVVLDGVIAGAAALAARALAPDVLGPPDRRSPVHRARGPPGAGRARACARCSTWTCASARGPGPRWPCRSSRRRPGCCARWPRSTAPGCPARRNELGPAAGSLTGVTGARRWLPGRPGGRAHRVLVLGGRPVRQVGDRGAVAGRPGPGGLRGDRGRCRTRRPGVGRAGPRPPAAPPGALGHAGNADLEVLARGRSLTARHRPAAAGYHPGAGGLPVHLAGRGHGGVRAVGRPPRRRPGAGRAGGRAARRVAGHPPAGGGGQQRGRLRRGTRPPCPAAATATSWACSTPGSRPSASRSGCAPRGSPGGCGDPGRRPPGRRPPRTPSWRAALSLFTVIPVGGPGRARRRERRPGPCSGCRCWAGCSAWPRRPGWLLGRRRADRPGRGSCSARPSRWRCWPC